MKQVKFYGLCFFAGLMVAFQTSARTHVYATINPMSCVPTSTTAEEKKYITTAGRVAFKERQTGLISFICQMPSFKRSKKIDAVNLTMDYYRRSSGGRIKASIRKVHRRTGAVSDVVTVNSAFGGSTRSFRSVSNGSQEKLSFEDYTYYLQFTLKQDRIEVRPPELEGQAPTILRMAVLNFLLHIVDK